MSTQAHHSILMTLLEGKQYEACRLSCESLIEQELQKSSPSVEELARLYLVLCGALVGLGEFRKAAENADYAWSYAALTKQVGLMAEARYHAGRAYGMGEDYFTAVARFTSCIDYGETEFRGKAWHGRGVAYRSLGDYSSAAQDFEAAFQWVTAHNEPWRQTCWLDLVWALILSRSFDKAERLIREFEQTPAQDRWIQLQVAHDRVHLQFLKGQHREALRQAIGALKEAGKDYPDVRAYIANTLMALAVHTSEPQTGFALGLLTKRLAAQAKRPDLDEEASRRLLDLHCKEGPDGLTAALLQIGEIRPGALPRTTRRRRA